MQHILCAYNLYKIFMHIKYLLKYEKSRTVYFLKWSIFKLAYLKLKFAETNTQNLIGKDSNMRVI